MFLYDLPFINVLHLSEVLKFLLLKYCRGKMREKSNVSMKKNLQKTLVLRKKKVLFPLLQKKRILSR